ncbi:MAG: hypothetical protein R3F48_07105 [Candidatus Zixiibacteriota bacterium]
MKNKSTALITILCIVFVTGMAVLSTPEDADAIPAFARKYNMSCTTCHAPFPRLKAYGDEFAGNGFVLADQDAPRYYVGTGDDKLSLIRDFPFAMRFEGFISHHTETDREVDLSTPYNIKLLSGGAISDNVAYYLYFFMSERGEVAGLEDAFIMFNNLFGTELDAYVGQFQISDPLFKRELRLTYDDFQIYRKKVGESNLNLTYDRGIMLTYGFESGTDIIFEVLNGAGLNHADDFRVYDTDKYKNVVGRISQDIGENLRLGVFGFYGKEGRTIEDTLTGPFFSTNKVWMAGPDATISYKDVFELNLQYMERRDDNPMFMSTIPDEEIETRGGLIECNILPQGDRSPWYFTGLFNYVESDVDINEYRTITGHIGHVFRTNMRFIFENTYDIENEENRFMVGVITAF